MGTLAHHEPNVAQPKSLMNPDEILGVLTYARDHYQHVWFVQMKYSIAGEKYHTKLMCARVTSVSADSATFELTGIGLLERTVPLSKIAATGLEGVFDENEPLASPRRAQKIGDRLTGKKRETNYKFNPRFDQKGGARGR